MSCISEESPGYLGFQLFQPGPTLRPYVREYWSFRRETLLPVYREEYMHPTGGFGIVFNFGDRVFLDAHPVAPPVFLDSANTTSRRMGFQGHVDIMGVRFQEGGAFPFLHVPLIDLQNELNLLDRLDDASLFQLHSRLCEATAMPTRIGLLEGWLVKQLSLGVARSGLIPESLARLRKEIALLRQGFGLSSIPKVADDLAISERQLEHLYRSQVGMTPKQYVRLQRIECARLALSHEKQPNAQLAAALGFYDQAHFIREFRAIIGVTPSAYMRRKHRDAAGPVVRGVGRS